MSDLIFICPHDSKIISKFRNEKLIINTDSYEKILDVIDNTKNNFLICINIETNQSLSSIPIQEKYKPVPIALKVKELGEFKDIIIKHALLRDSNLKIFFPSDNNENLVNLQILSSLGIYTGVYFNNNDKTDWDKINDLMHSYIYSHLLLGHAPIEPFMYIIENYHPEKYIFFNAPYFENPKKYLFIDNDFNIAFSQKDLVEKKIIASGYSELKTVTENPIYKKEINNWRKHFLDGTICSSCAAWRICQGCFYELCNKNNNCKQFFLELIEAVDFYYSRNEKGKKWQS